jgi:hypothetical protein
MCIDYFGFNEVTWEDAYPLQHVHDTLDELHDADFDMDLELLSIFLIFFYEGDVLNTAFTTPDSQMEWLAMPVGLCNAPAIFIKG